MTVFVGVIKSSTSELHHPAELLIIDEWQQYFWYFQASVDNWSEIIVSL